MGITSKMEGMDWTWTIDLRESTSKKRYRGWSTLAAVLLGAGGYPDTGRRASFCWLSYPVKERVGVKMRRRVSCNVGVA